MSRETDLEDCLRTASAFKQESSSDCKNATCYRNKKGRKNRQIKAKKLQIETMTINTKSLFVFGNERLSECLVSGNRGLTFLGSLFFMNIMISGTSADFLRLLFSDISAEPRYGKTL